jgi:hypothetical protein
LDESLESKPFDNAELAIALAPELELLTTPETFELSAVAINKDSFARPFVALVFAAPTAG